MSTVFMKILKKFILNVISDPEPGACVHNFDVHLTKRTGHFYTPNFLYGYDYTRRLRCIWTIPAEPDTVRYIL